MAEEDIEYQPRKPPRSAVLVAVILGAGIAWLLATALFELSPPWIALPAGGACGAFGFFLGESIGDAIVFSLILGLLVALFLTVGPAIWVVRACIVPMAAGFCVGKLVYGLWTEVCG